jgi:hypothetical protein
MLNPFFSNGSKSEQNLVQDLINEHLRMFGVDIYYLPRRVLGDKKIFKEYVKSKFDKALALEAYIANYNGFGGSGDLLSKFGVRATDELNLIISKERFEEVVSPFITDSQYKLDKRPKEGDLIYFQLTDALFEIKYVEHEVNFYQLNKLYVYELRCELFEYEDEDIDTGNIDIDDDTEDRGYFKLLTLAGAGSTATANISGINSGGIQYICVNNSGYGYLNNTTVSIGTAPSGGVDATGKVVVRKMSGISTFYGVQNVYLTNPGSGYTGVPRFTFNGIGFNAEASCRISDGVIGPIVLTGIGSGYIFGTNPTVTISSPGIGTTAKATAIVSAAGTISEIRITNAGSGYTATPSITIEPPPGIGIGTFIYNEIVTGSVSGATARVKNWNAVTRELRLAINSGQFVSNEIIVGSESSATYRVSTVNDDPAIDPIYQENINIQSLADNIIDFTENNPFGDY